ncbi:hypothetical protein NUU61_002933 [Penicillium alfredii]|uniref:EthD domain-containing protein n=1 Tax=Penicillium alfredii TaxID=1506179 RepID=A0A9W9KH18_9EURO|nr:uncharacterized protein NUU61_002933 [Penicillium alfredii]KAJ5105586.1 hypothetical protein NUU61_002933 [Penicillium alfredii]
MSIRILLFATRKPTLTPAEFKAHYENNHVPLIQRLAGADFPATHIRRYLARSTEPNSDGEYPATVLFGSQEEFGYDAVTEVVFSDQEAKQRFFAKLTAPEAKKLLEEDEELFLVREKLSVVVIGDCLETK